MYIYKVTNKINNKIYIGMTTQNVVDRFSHHFYEAKKGSTSYFHRALIKHGRESFSVCLLDKACTIQELKEKEIFYISKYNSLNRSIGYNLSKGGDGSPGVKFSEETKDKIRQKALNRKASPETRKLMSLRRKGLPLDPNTKLSLAKIAMRRKKNVIIHDILSKNSITVKGIVEASSYFKCSRDTITRYSKVDKLINDRYKITIINNN